MVQCLRHAICTTDQPTKHMPYEFYLGIDVPGEQKPITLSLIEKEEHKVDGTEEDHYHVRQVTQLDSDGADEEEDEKVVDHVQSLLAQEPYVGRTVLVINCTQKEGRTLREQMDARGLSPEGVVVTGGEESKQQGESGLSTPNTEDNWLTVKERALISTLDRVYHEGRLELPQENTDEASRVAQGLQDYRVAADSDAGEGYQPDVSEDKRHAAHASYVYSAALACWIGEEHDFDASAHLGGELPTTGPAKRERAEREQP